MEVDLVVERLISLRSFHSRRRRSPIVLEAGGASSSSFSFRRKRNDRYRVFEFDDTSDEDDPRYFGVVNDGGAEEQVDGDEGEHGVGDAVAEDPSRRGGGRAGEDHQLPRPRAEEEEDSDDERPIRFVCRRGSTGPSQEPPPEPAATAPEPSPSSCSDNRSSVIRDATVEDNGALDCGICYLPLKPPIFQVLGHGSINPWSLLAPLTCDLKLRFSYMVISCSRSGS